MKINEAYSILELSQNATPEEAKKKYRELTKKYHPDVNKDPGAEDKFKKINEAYKCVQDGKGNEHSDMDYGFNNPFGRSHVIVEPENVNIYTTISFKDSVFGKKQEMKFSRSGKCNDCSGRGETVVPNGCTKCNGRGQIVTKEKHVIFARPCDSCHGKSNKIPCKSCNSQGCINTNISVHVDIPGGVVNGNILRLGGMGNFVGNFMGFDQFTDAYLHVTVTQETGLTISGMNVISNLEISLLEALSGCNKTVNTVIGDKEITIKPLSKNNEEVILPNLGVSKVGAQKIILNVKYPDDVSNLINILSAPKEV